MMKPLGHRVLVKPDEQPEASESGLIQLPQDRDHVACSGTVVAVGNGSQLIREARQRAFRDAIAALKAEDVWDYYGVLENEAYPLLEMMADAPCQTPSVQVGDRVVIPVEAGMNVSEDGVQYVIVNEDDLVIIVDDEAAA